jgi:carboxypeptidase PM20D1
MKKFLRFLLLFIVVLLIIIIVKTFTFKSLQIKQNTVNLPSFSESSVEHLSTAISFPTVSVDPDLPIDTVAFSGYHTFLAEAYPLINSRLEKEVFSEFSLLYKWQGSNLSLKPVILMAHMDVVPAGEAKLWTKPPFSGENDGTYIWGRGALDDKSQMISILEAVEMLLSEGYQPERTFYFAFGHDEELYGKNGAMVIAAALKERGVEAEFILDEGMAVTVGIVPMIDEPVALIGTSEKGYLSVTLSVEMPQGSSSTPEKETSITVLNNALNNIETKQMKAYISEPVNDFLRYIGPEMPLYAKAIFANKWLFKSIILNIYQGSSSGNALVRTTTAPSMLIAGVKDNVIPAKAEAVVNFRILAGETTSDVFSHLTKVIDDERVKITAWEGYSDPSPVSPVDVFGFEIILNTIRQIYPEAVVAPTMMLAASDSRNYSEISDNIYRFAPIILTSEDMATVHGSNEKNAISNFGRAIGFYYQLLKNSDPK